ncbi:MAG: anaerobic glycerol-3-phosphate dehydrogenase subunit C [Deltaproteobacteria bacterium]|nr:anaerobic glycerol-3-phosphate dehydrogenase subunit C [Deltaproteobacteria bacterium]
MKSNIDQCIKCSICNVYCPVLQTTGLFPGPKLSGPDAERFRLQRKAIPSDWLAFCDYCKICEMVCPHNVPIPELHVRSRIAWGKKRRPSSREWLLGHSYLLERLGSWTAPFSNWLVGWAFFRWLLDRGLGIDRRTKIPFFRRQTFERWFRSRPFMSGKPIAYFYGCYTNYIDPALGRAVVEVLEKNGFRVTLPAQECCGLPLIGNGFFDLAARLGEKNLKSLRKSVDEGLEVVFSSPSCGMTLMQEYGYILHIPGSSVVAENLYEISQFLLRLYEEQRLNTNFKKINETYYYHVPCHLRALQVGLPALELLYLIPGLQIIELPEGCCGLAGTYGFKRDNYAVAREIGEEIFQAIRKLDARRVISDCEACRMQIAHQTGVKTFHTIQILRQAYGE